MAIVKIISHGKNVAGTKNVLSYVLELKKTGLDLCGTLGDISEDAITAKAAFLEFQRIRNLFGKDKNGRTYTHGTVSWAPGEITHDEAVEFAREYLPEIYPGHQIVYAVHQDAEHVHFHFIVNTVSFLDGSMLHWSKHDLERAKQLCNELCLNRGWSIAQKGLHHDGRAFVPGELTAWDKNKYHELIKNPKQSYLCDLALAIKESLSQAASPEDFCRRMEMEHAWQVIWQDKKKHITFVDFEGHKVRDTNISKTFSMNISKEGILQHIEMNRTLKVHPSIEPPRRSRRR